MSNTQNTDEFNRLLTLANSSSDASIISLIADMVSYSSTLEAAIDADAETFNFSNLRSSEFKNRIDQLDASIIEELGALLLDFLAYIVTFEYFLYFSVESFQGSSTLTSSDANNIVTDIRKKGKSKIPPAASLPSRPRPEGSEELDLTQIQVSMNQFQNEFDSGLYNLLLSFISFLEVLDFLSSFVESNRVGINSLNYGPLNQLTRDMVSYSLSLAPGASGISTPQIFSTPLSPQFTLTLNGIQNGIGASLYSEFQSFLDYIETLENASN